MDSVIDFVKKFHPSSLGLGLWNILAIVGLTLVGLVLINWTVSFLPSRTGDLIKKVVRQTFNLAYYGLIVLITLNAIFTGDYGYFLVVVFLFISSKIDYLYKLYDDFVDRKINRD